jgi:ElaB/YqjD/DUF883 family membrane-anchored ribosome-binding protein
MSKLGENLKSASDSAKDSIATVRAKASETTAIARNKATDALDKSMDAAISAVQTSKDLATKAITKSSDSLDKNPLAVVLGGLALGVIVGALLPKSQHETKVLGKAGKKLNKKARKIADAAKDAGKDKVSSLGLSGDAVREQFRDLVSKATEAVKAAGQAASDAARKQD